MNKEIPLFTPGFSADEDTIKAVGEPMVGLFNSSHWAHDLDNAANRKFVAAFQKEYGRLPTMYAQQAWDVALVLDAAIRAVKGNLEDKKAFQKAIESAKIDSPRGNFRFNTNHMPIQDYYLREVVKDSGGRITNKTVTKVFSNHQDAFVGKCKMG